MEERKTDVSEITVDQLLDLRNSGTPLILVDVLSHDHFLRVHLPGAINIPVDKIRELAPWLLGQDDPIVVYCANPKCTASPTAAKIFIQLGYTNVADFTGGIQEWIDRDLPLVVSEDLRREIERHEQPRKAA